MTLIYVSHQSATELMIEEGNFAFVRRKIHENLRHSDDTEGSDEVPVFQCPDPEYARTFNSVAHVELYVSVGQHTEGVYDRFKRDYAVKFSSGPNSRRRNYH